MSKARSPRADCSRTVGITEWRKGTSVLLVSSRQPPSSPCRRRYLISEISYSSEYGVSTRSETRRPVTARRHETVFPGFREMAQRRKDLSAELVSRRRVGGPVPDRGGGAHGHVAVRRRPSRGGGGRRPALHPGALRGRRGHGARLAAGGAGPVTTPSGTAPRLPSRPVRRRRTTDRSGTACSTSGSSSCGATSTMPWPDSLPPSS